MISSHVFMILLALAALLKADEIPVKELSFRLKYASLKLERLYVIDVLVSNEYQTDLNSRNPEYPDVLKIKCNLSQFRDGNIIRVQTSFLTDEGLNTLMKYKFEDSLDIFGGLWSSSKNGEEWKLSCYDLFDKNKKLASYTMSDKDYRKFINAIKFTVIVREKIERDWNGLIKELSPPAPEK